MLEHKPISLKLLMTLAFSTLGQRAFMNRTVGEIMWGYDDPLVNFINKYLPDTFPVKGKFGLFAEVSTAQGEVQGLCLVLHQHILDTSYQLAFGAGWGALGGVGVNGRKPSSYWLKYWLL